MTTASNSAFADWRQDVARYPAKAWVTELSVYAITVYRLGRGLLGLPTPLRLATTPLYALLHLLVQMATGISLPRNVPIGPGLRIHHFGGIIVHSSVVIGSGVTMGHGVTIGIRESDAAPRLEDDVYLGAYAQILGDVTVGTGSKVGAMSLVLEDVPPRVRVAGVPARVLGERRETGAGTLADPLP